MIYLMDKIDVTLDWRDLIPTDSWTDGQIAGTKISYYSLASGTKISMTSNIFQQNKLISVKITWNMAGHITLSIILDQLGTI